MTVTNSHHLSVGHVCQQLKIQGNLRWPSRACSEASQKDGKWAKKRGTGRRRNTTLYGAIDVGTVAIMSECLLCFCKKSPQFNHAQQMRVLAQYLVEEKAGLRMQGFLVRFVHSGQPQTPGISRLQPDPGRPIFTRLARQLAGALTVTSTCESRHAGRFGDPRD